METKQKKLLLRCVDDSVIIMSFVLDDGYFVKRQGTKEEIETEIKKASEAFPQERLPIISWEEINDSDLPDRAYRDAWITKGGKKIEHDIVKAKEIHKNLLRGFRNCYFAKLDVEYQKAEDAGDEEKKLLVSRKRQELRDVTTHPAIEKAKTVQELKNLGVLPIIRIMKTNPVKGLQLRKEDLDL
jgi:hypothetical protein